MANETVLLRSGDIYFSPSAGGSNIPLPAGKKLWLNEQILDLYQQIQDMSGTGGKDGKDGREVVMKIGIFPEGSPDKPENYAIQWRWQPRAGEPDTPWQVLIRYVDIKGETGAEGPAGPEGPEGPMGPSGTAIQFKGSVTHAAELIAQVGAKVGDGYLETSTGFLWVLMAEPAVLLSNWQSMGKISGPKGDKGVKGDRGPKGEKGDAGQAGSISMFIVQWMVDTATSAAMSGVMIEVSSMVNDAINDAINQLMSQMENMVEQAVEKTIEDMMDELKGDKGEKGDKGDDGKDGKSVRMVGKYDTLTEFATLYPASEDTVGCAALIGKANEDKILWAITEVKLMPGAPATYKYEEMGDIRGPKGEDASWEISIRDKDFVETKHITVESDLPNGVPGMFIQETESILIEGLSGSQVDPNQVGFRMRMKYPIPRITKEGDQTPGYPVTTGKVLGNDGDKLVWVDGGTGGGSNTQEEILLKGSDGRIWALSVDDDGRLHQDLSIETTDTDMLKLESPNGQKWGITINNAGKLNISEVV